MALDLKSTRTLLWAAVLVLAFIASGLYAYTTLTKSGSTGIGAGSYTLATADGEVFNRDSLKGQPTMLFFGYTHCPEVCPTTLYEMSNALTKLGGAAKDFRVFFITGSSIFMDITNIILCFALVYPIIYGNYSLIDRCLVSLCLYRN